jgi:CheY-like chemotaxis protein
LEQNLAAGLPAIEGDPGQIQQIVMNLVINAAESIPERPGKVTVTTGAVEIGSGDAAAPWGDTLQAGSYVRLEVRDNGVGMSKDLVARIFDPFFTTKFTGRGLGLAAVQGIVRAHHGAITVNTAPGEGSVFLVLLPASSAPVITTAEEQSFSQLQGTGTILVIDDEEVVRTASAAALQRFGYTVLTAPDGHAGFDVFDRYADRIAAVVLDMTMPVLSGEATFQKLRATWPEACVILSSGYDEREAVQRFPADGIAAFIQKPYSAARLASVVKRAIDSK